MLAPSWKIGRPSSRRVQLSTDALASYPEAIERGFGSEVDMATRKTYGVTNLNKDAGQ